MNLFSFRSPVSTAFVVGFVLLAVGCMQAPRFRNAETLRHEDGTYRGVFVDEGVIQVNVEFRLEDGVMTEASFRHLVGAYPEYNLDTEEEPYRSVVGQYHEALQHLVGKPLSTHLADLYEPGKIVATEVDGYSGATIRSVKILSAIRDALNRGAYGR